MDNYLDGDIVTTNNAKFGEDELLLVKCHERYATALRLQENKPKENSVKVVSRTEMWGDTGKLGYIYYDKITGYIKTLPEEELDKVREKIMESIGAAAEYPRDTEFDSIMNDGPQEDNTQLRELKHMVQDLADTIHGQAETQRTPNEEDVRLLQKALNRAETERDIYKSLYEQERGLWNVSEIGAIQAAGERG